MRTTIAVALLFFAVQIHAGTITSIDPDSFEGFSGQHVITVFGDGLGNVLVFDGPTGPLDAGIMARDEKSVTGRVPDHVINTPGRYTIAVRGDDGDTAPFPFEVTDPWHPLVLLMPDPVVVLATSREGAKVEFEVIPWGGRDPNPTVTCDPPSGSLFPVGPSKSQCIARNSFGETARGEVTIYVQDGSAPVLTLPDDIVVEAENEEGTVVTFEATAHDDVDGELPVTCSPESGSRFPIGITTVQCSATDSHLNPGEGSFTIEVTKEDDDETTLVIQVPDSVTLEAESSAGTSFSFVVTSHGSDDPSPQISCDPPSGSVFPLGSTLVQCFATDVYGNTASGSFTVTVSDSTAPHVGNVRATPNVLEPADHKLVPVTILVDTADVVDPQPRCTIVDVTANEPILGEGSGNTDFDWRITGELDVELRAERSGQGNGRIYTVHVNCTDFSGNTSASSVEVTVPKGNNSGEQAVVSNPKGRRRAAGKP